MRILLDTHIWIWHLQSSEKLPASLKTLLTNQQNELWISPISAWETMILAARGKVRLEPNAQAGIRKAMDTGDFKQAPLNMEVAIKSREVDLPHQDPADRFLAATSLVYDLPLATIDIHLLEAEWLSTVPL